MTLPAVPPEDLPEQTNGQAPTIAPGQQQLPLEIRRVEHMQYSGPLPPAEALLRYEQVHPGLAERIVSMAEREQQHRHRVESAEVEEPFRLARRGQVCAVAVVVLMLGFAALLAFLGHVVAGAILAGVDILGLVVVFVTGQSPPSTPDSQERPADSADETGAAAEG